MSGLRAIFNVWEDVCLLKKTRAVFITFSSKDKADKNRYILDKNRATTQYGLHNYGLHNSDKWTRDAIEKILQSSRGTALYCIVLQNMNRNCPEKLHCIVLYCKRNCIVHGKYNRHQDIHWLQQLWIIEFLQSSNGNQLKTQQHCTILPPEAKPC